jgi:hypothetical protein
MGGLGAGMPPVVPVVVPVIVPVMPVLLPPVTVPVIPPLVPKPLLAPLTPPLDDEPLDAPPSLSSTVLPPHATKGTTEASRQARRSGYDIPLADHTAAERVNGCSAWL